jgi:hypothetical protein
MTSAYTVYIVLLEVVAQNCAVKSFNYCLWSCLGVRRKADIKSSEGLACVHTTETSIHGFDWNYGLLSVYPSIYLSMALQSFCWTLAAFSVC